MKCLSVLRASLVSLLFLLGLATPARADAIYTYVGGPFTTTDFFGGFACPPECNVTGSFTLSQPLAPNLNEAFIMPVSFAFTDGLDIINNANFDPSAANFRFTFSTDATGNITLWAIILITSPGTFPEIDTVNGPVPGIPKFGVNGDRAFGLMGGADDVFPTDVSNPGHWSMTSAAPTPTPEPGSLLLLGTGLLGIMGAARRKWLG